MKKDWKKALKTYSSAEQKSGRITEKGPPKNLVAFSYKYLDSNHPKFQYHKKDAVYFCKVLERLRDLSYMTVLDITENRSSSLRTHPIQWKQTTEKKFGIPKESEIVDTPYQFEVTSNKHGRVHGFFIGPVFYIVWFDPDHRLYK